MSSPNGWRVVIVKEWWPSLQLLHLCLIPSSASPVPWPDVSDKGHQLLLQGIQVGAMRTHEMGSSPSLQGPACPCPLPQYIRLPSPTSCPVDFEAARQMQTTAHRDGLELSQLQKFQSLQQIQSHVYMEPLKGGSSASRSNPD